MALDPRTCRALSEAFFRRVPADPVLREIYPKHLRCATDAIAWYLAELSGGPPEYSQKRRWTPSLKQAHEHFKLTERHREAWLKTMSEAMEEAGIKEPDSRDLKEFLETASAFLLPVRQALMPAAGSQPASSGPLTKAWQAQLRIEELIATARKGEVEKAISILESEALKAHFAKDPKTEVQILALISEKAPDYFANRLRANPAIGREQLLGDRTLLHHFAGTNNAAAIHELHKAGADLNATFGTQRTTALHVAARFGNLEATKALLDCGADPGLRDTKGDTPLKRAQNCRRHEVAKLLIGRSGPGNGSRDRERIEVR